MILNSEDNENKGYFIKNRIMYSISNIYEIEEPTIKTHYIEFYKLIKNFKNSVKNTNLYPPHFKKYTKLTKKKYFYKNQ